MSELGMFIEHLNHSPRVLLLGQRLFGTDDGINPLFRATSLATPPSIYEQCVGVNAVKVQAKLDQAGNTVPLDPALELFRRFPWRCIFTSAIDPIPFRLFHDAKRRPVVSAFEPRLPDVTSLMLYRLFGATGRPVAAELPPSTAQELTNRRTSNIELVGSIPQAVGPSGRLFIEGWHPGRKDWLRARDLGSILNRLTTGQILLFGVDEQDRADLENDDDFGPLLTNGKAILFGSALSNLLVEADKQGTSIVDEALIAPDTVTISVRPHTPDKKKLQKGGDPGPLIPIRLSLQEYKRLTETISIPGDPRSHVDVIETDDEKARAFLEFLSRDPLSHLEDCERFGFRRDVFQNDVTETVFDLLDTSAPQENTVVLTGQSGSGKSIMVALLAIGLRRAGIPVIVIGNRLTPPNRRHIEDFLQIVDSHSSVAMAILWDGLEAPEEYQRLSRLIASLGKKALVVGTSYQLGVNQSRKTTSTRFVEIPIEAGQERDRLLTHFANYLPGHEAVLKKYAFDSYKNFFELIYFLTSASRRRLVEGLDAEFSSHVQSLDRYLDKYRTTPEEKPLGIFGRALRDAYGNQFDEILRSADIDESSSTSNVRSPALRLVESIMAVSSLGVKMPQSIALSLCREGNANSFEVYQKAFNEFPLIDAFEDRGNYFVRSRHRLEAELWTSRRFQSKLEMLSVILNVASQIKCVDARSYKSDELEFAVRLLQTVGSEGPQAYKVPEGYLKIAECISAIEERCGRLNPRLLLLKANSLREHVQQTQGAFRNASGRLDHSILDANTLDVWESHLDDAVEALTQAEADLVRQIGLSAQARGSRTMLAVLSTEKAATIGGQLICLSAALRVRGSKSDFQSLRGTLDRARIAWRRSLSIDEENPRATDTACWIIRNLLEECPVPEELRYELLAEWSDLITHYEELALNPDQLDKFQRREHEFAKEVDDRERLANVLKTSTARGSYAIHALIARMMIDAEGSKTAMDYLEENCKERIFDQRSLLPLYIRLWWRVHTGRDRYFDLDETVTGFTADQWQTLLALARARLSFEGESENQLALFHSAWASLQLGLSKDAQEFLNVLDTISVGNFRRGRALVLLSEPNGEPREFSGESRPGAYSHRGRVWIEELRLEIPYLTAQFPEATTGATLTGFHVALNYRGAFVQPSSTYNNKRARLQQEQRNRA